MKKLSRNSTYGAILTLALVASACTAVSEPASTTGSPPQATMITSTTLDAPEITTTTAPATTTTTTVVLSDVEPALTGAASGDWRLFPGSGNGGYDVTLVDLTLVLSDDMAQIEGVAAITAHATQDLQRFSLDARDLNIASVSVGGEEVESDIVGPELVVTLDDPLAEGDPFTVSVTYSAEPQRYLPPGVPFPMGWDRSSSGDLLFVHGFPGAAATWAPVNESKDDPARFIVRIDAPDGLEVTGSGFRSEDGDFVVWDTQQEIGGSTFAISDYEQSTIEWNGIPIELDLTPDSPVRDKWSELIPEMLDFHESVFGPFPFERLGISAINGKQFALSDATRILIPESMPSPVLAHELAHQWAGNAVHSTDPETYSWMFEGLATYAEALFINRDNDSIPDLRFGVPSETRPLDRVDSVDDLLDAVTYQRGALLYHALRLEIGEDAFFDTLREFIQRNLHGTAEIEDLQAVAEELSGQDLTAFFTGWVSESAVPELPPIDG
ncbi:MAG: hypothetical protein M3112_09970 [Actinomycetia bacterium]|nr:hypothetical protein [Actinomycetes bacterium]